MASDLVPTQNLKLIEINFERKPQFAALFSSNDPQQILLNLSSDKREIVPEKSLEWNMPQSQVKRKMEANRLDEKIML